MKYKTIKKWSLRIILILVVISIASCIGVKSQIKQHLGAKTELINPSIFKIDESPLAIKNVSVLSTDCTKMLDSLTVLIRNGKIISITKDVSITNEYNIIDGTGQYLIPGLVDTHAHLHDSKNDLLLYLANGVTHISEMFGQERHLKWRKEAEDGALSPKIYVASRKLASKKGIMSKIRSWFGSSPNYTTTNKARKAVRKHKEEGYNALKLSTFLNTEIYYAITDEAKKQNIPTIGHLTSDVSLKGLYTSGQSQLAHIEEITKATMHDFGGLSYDNTEAYLTYLKKNVDAIAIELKEIEMVVSSTIWLMESLPKQKFDIENFLKTIELEYQNPGEIEGSKLAKGWLPGNNSYENLDIKNNPEKAKKSKLFWKTYVEAIHIMTKALADNGVTITAGTDSNTAGVIAGFSLHDELESLNKSGLTNSQVLYAATLAPAKWMQSDAGKIEVGLRADLVLLEKNPLEDINNTRTINAVIANGKFLDRTILDKMLQSIKDANNRSRKINIDTFIN
ncbi:amidohydrolase family protein [Pontimicrobium sp. SW4]|uniref:Amidohydrolase family protein n=1 Tax=Pontimicrobium sp. SW4 TaxID=3153519 RepID=A0AAU7BQJ5_9FLAO